jgi:hypothetical protein
MYHPILYIKKKKNKKCFFRKYLELKNKYINNY